MKKRIYLIVFICLNTALLYSQITQIIRFNQSDLEVYPDGEGYSHLYLKDTYSIDDPGKPELPVLIQSFVLPVDAEVTGIQVNALARQRVPGTYWVFPAQLPVPVNIAQEEIDFTSPDLSVYNTNNPFPGKQVEIISDQFEMGYHIVTVKVYPVEYIPQYKELYLCSFDFTINYQTTAIPESQRSVAPASFYRQELLKKNIEYKVENKIDVERFQSVSQNTSGVQRSLYQRDLTKDNPDYIIITNEELKSSFQVLADWKTKKGVNTIIKTTEEISREYPGCDLQEKIRNYLKQAYSLWGEGMFVLLGGHVNVIPARIVEGEKISSQQPSDLYYATVQGTWNANNNHLFGESTWSDDIDYNYAFYLGRAPVENLTQAQTFVNKVLSYEKTLNVSNLNYYNNTLMAHAFITYENGIYKTLRKASLFNTSQYIKNASSVAKTWLLFDDNDCTLNNVDYGNSAYCNSYPGDEEFDKTSFLAALNNRGNFPYGNFHIIYHMDHSNAVTMGASSLYKGQSVSKKDFQDLSNNHHWQILMTGGCEPATFNVNCIGKEYLNNPQGGGVAFIGNADVGLDYEVPQFDRFIKFLFNNFNGIGYSLGYAFHAAIAQNNNGQRRRLTLLGDPEMPVWTSTPQTLQVNKVATRIPATGEYTISVTIPNLPAGRKALVCLQKGDEIYERHFINNTQANVYTVKPQTTGAMNITVTSHNFKPYETSLSLTGSVDLKVENIIIDNNSYAPADTYVDAGKNTEFKIGIQNTGNTSLSGLGSWPAVLSCNSPYATIVRESTTFSPVAISGTGISAGNFSIRVDKDAPELLSGTNSALDFELTITGNNNISYTLPFCINVVSPEIELGNQQITSTVTTGGYTDHSFTIYLFNSGKGDASGVKARLIPRGSNVVDYSTGYFTYPDIASKQTLKNASPVNYSVRVASQQANSPILFTLELENQYGKTWSFDFDLNNRPTAIPKSDIKFIGYKNEINLYWTPVDGAIGYNIYRSDVNAQGAAVGNFTKINAYPVTPAYFNDTGLSELTKYAYKIATINAEKNEAIWQDYLLAWTSLQPIDLFPVSMEVKATAGNNPRNKTPISVFDVNNDSKKEIFTAIDKGDSEKYGMLVALKEDGTDLFDIDNNPTTRSGFATFEQSIQGSAAIGDLFGNGEYQVVSVGRDFAAANNYLTCHAVKDTNNDNNPDLLWQVSVDKRRYRRGPILANLDNSPDNSLEIIICNIESTLQNNVIRIYNNQGNLLHSFGSGKGYSALAVADLDGDGDMEIIAGFLSGVHIWHHDGTAFSVNPFFTRPDYYFDSTPVVCDLNGDGVKDILISARPTSGAQQRQLFVIDQNGNVLSGWGSNQKVPLKNDIATSHMPVVGDINNDGVLEVIALGENCIKIWKKGGTLLREIPMVNIPNSLSSINPILADIDGDNKAEIVFGYKSLIHAYKYDGSQAEGFPLNVDGGVREIQASVCVADVTGNGKNNLVAGVEEKIYMWETEGNPDVIEWGSERRDSHNRGRISLSGNCYKHDHHYFLEF